jgi:hypothetical protein
LALLVEVNASWVAGTAAAKPEIGLSDGHATQPQVWTLLP